MSEDARTQMEMEMKAKGKRQDKPREGATIEREYLRFFVPTPGAGSDASWFHQPTVYRDVPSQASDSAFSPPVKGTTDAELERDSRRDPG